jgi:MoaA/NifB/PqqE/SkfB family radical SAM enzyme
MGVRDIGFGIVISDRNVSDLLDLYHLCARLGVEFGGSTMHNSFYFHKHNNHIENLDMTLDVMRDYVRALLRSKRRNLRMRTKDWFRAYINMGLMQHMQGKSRPLPCGAGTDSFFLDPWGNMLACNGSDEPWIMGNLKDASFEEIWHSERAAHVRGLAKNCGRNCWMTGTAVPAMRKKVWVPILWVLKNKLRLVFGKEPALDG